MGVDCYSAVALMALKMVGMPADELATLAYANATFEACEAGEAVPVEAAAAQLENLLEPLPAPTRTSPLLRPPAATSAQLPQRP